MLQLQIEPHFLFNTLGSAQQLAERGAPEAARLISNLIRFLRAATPSMRNEATTLAQEAALIGAYLEIMKTPPRRAARLRRVACPTSFGARALPPGMLITLVENAIKHGIELSPDGGRIDVRAERGGAGMLVLTVADTGAGLDGGSQPGRASALRTSASGWRCCSAMQRRSSSKATSREDSSRASACRCCAGALRAIPCSAVAP